MSTVLSHIVQKRLSNVNEDVATDALAFILESSVSARAGFMKLLRGIDSGLPPLRFRTQQTEGSIRPDMWGFDESGRRVFVENKFWAGLTDNQPVSYLQQLAGGTQPTLLLVVVPAAREQTILRELRGRCGAANLAMKDRDPPAGIVFSVDTNLGPVLALTTWPRLLSALRLEAAEDATAMADLAQLAALCEAADDNAFVPFSAEDTSDQRTPAFITQVGAVVQDAVQLAVTEGAVNLNGLRPQASWNRTGRYLRFREPSNVMAWIGINFRLWKKHGRTPLWLVFDPGGTGNAMDFSHALEPWAARKGLTCDTENEKCRIGLDLVTGQEKDIVVRSITADLEQIAQLLALLQPHTAPADPPDE